MMRITLLGTGTSLGVPMIGCNCHVCSSTDPRDKRLRSSVLLETDTTSILIDVSPDFRQQALRANIKKIDAILITHEHKDHIGGLDDIKPFNYLSHCPIPLFAEPNVIQIIQKDFDYAFRSSENSVPQLVIHEVNYPNNFIINDLTVIPIRLFHDQLPILGFRIGKFAYLTDFSYIEESELNKLNGLDTLIIVALRHSPHPKHLSFSQALEIISRLNPRTARLTHISHKLGCYTEIAPLCPKNIRPGFDNEMLTLR
ncbi:MAG TPA: MBL fold metallo-hydrolase [Salinivirgaceae bacterium]|nr:MBL fold metallo-hydrolase [Salinivirgaceae bacterium]